MNGAQHWRDEVAERATEAHDPAMMGMTRRLSWLLVAAMLLAGAASAADQAEGTAKPAGTNEPTAADHDVTISSSHPDSTLPPLPPDKFTDCLKRSTGGIESLNGVDLIQSAICQHELNGEKRIVVNACLNRDGESAPPRAIQACTELLDRQIFEGRERFWIFASRAKAYLTRGDQANGLTDLNQAIELAPRDADLYFDRGLVYAAQPDLDAALRDFDQAIRLNSKLVPALEQRAKLHQIQKNVDAALADYSEGIRLQPKSAVLWSGRGYAYMQKKDYKSAVSDESEAIRLDPRFARALYLRGAAYGNLGDSQNASDDIKAAVNLDASMASYIVIQGKSVSLTMPPL